MNDRFKFRVWNKIKNNYLKDFVFNFINKAPYITIEYFDNEYEYTHTFEEDEIIIEQCTGLKDKNGKLIYDGDYIRSVNQDTKDRPDLQVGHIWVDEMGCRWIKFKTEELSWNDFCSLIDYDATLEIEVIGNEHEERNFEQI